MTDESHGDTAAPAEVPRHIGALDRRPERPLILVVAHAAGSQLFGGERSLLTLLDGLDAAGLDTLVALPLGPDPVYRDAVALRSTGVVELPVPPRRPCGVPQSAVVDAFAAVIRACGIAAVHANTIVPHEALLAARRLGIPAVVHARDRKSTRLNSSHT